MIWKSKRVNKYILSLISNPLSDICIKHSDFTPVQNIK